MPVATLLGLGAVAVLLAAVVAAFVRQPDTQRSATRHPPPVIGSPASPTSQPQSTASGSTTPATPRQHPKAKVLGQTVQRKPHGHGQALPFTGSAPVVPTSAVGLVVLVAGSWLLVRWPAAAPAAGYDATLLADPSVTARSPRNDGAIGRLRSPGHQFALPSSAATDGTSSDRTTNVSNSSPAVTAKPVS
jgi:hypothetical protein